MRRGKALEVDDHILAIFRTLARKLVRTLRLPRLGQGGEIECSEA